MTARSKYWCDTCESVVYADDVHSCYDAKAVRDQQERERALTVDEREELVRLRERLASVEQRATDAADDAAQAIARAEQAEWDRDAVLAPVVEAAVAYIHPPESDPWGYGDDERFDRLKERVTEYVAAISRASGGEGA